MGYIPVPLTLNIFFQHATGHVTKGALWENYDFSICVQNPANNFPISTTGKLLSYKSLFLII